MTQKINIVWLRRDLRLEDNTAISKALEQNLPVLILFVFDKKILNQFENKYDRRVDYIHGALENINEKLNKNAVLTYFSSPLEAFEDLSQKFEIKSVFCNEDYEPKTIERDKKVANFLLEKNISFLTFKDQVIFHKNDILKKGGTPYTVFTPYANKWKSLIEEQTPKVLNYTFDKILSQEKAIISLKEIGFEKTDLTFKEPFLDEEIIKDYDKFRDFPALEKTTQLGMALRFGTISIRKCVLFAQKHNQTWLSELIWREFFMQILYHFPKVETQSFKNQYDNIRWRNNETEFEAWCQGKTGYPIVDAGMIQLNSTGFMHNRVRMIVASFLCKHLLIDWRWGEAYFAQKLNDYDLAANNGNWQWAAGSGCDAAPYFRVFSPALQTQKFDKNLEYVKKWNPDYVKKLDKLIVDHDFARKRALEVYKQGLS